MKLPEFAVRRPVTVFMATVALTIFGLISAGQLPLELLPDLAYPTLTVQTEYPDAAPTSVEQFVTRPLEEAVGVIPGIREMRSVSRPGLSEVVLEFGWDEAMDFAAMEVREKIGLAELPREADPPRVLRFDPSLDPIARLAFTGGDHRDLDELRQIADRWLKPRLEAVPGVAAAKVRGGLDPEIQVEADEARLAALGLTLDDLAQALRAENVNRPGGTLKDWGSVYLVRTLHEFEDLEQLRRTVVRETATGRVRVEDVASVRRGHKDREEITRSEGVETVEIALHREGSANTIAVSAEIHKELESLREQMSDDLELSLLTDQSTYIEAAIDQVWSAAALGGLLAILVLYFFLRDLRATAIIAVTIPISVIATFLPIYRAGVTLNIMSLGGLALGIGMLVDNSIVVLEAIDRHRRAGVGRREASARGAGEVAGAVAAATLTTVSVFLPIVFVQGIAGQLFYDLAVTVCLSLIASLIVSLTVVPMLSAFEWAGLRQTRPGDLWQAVVAVGESDPKPFTMRIGRLAIRPVGSGRSFLSKGLTVVLFPLLAIILILQMLFIGIAGLLRLVFLSVIAVLVGAWWGISRIFGALTWPLRRPLDMLIGAYPRGLRQALRFRWAILPIAFGIFALSIGGATLLGTDLVPDLSQGEFAFRLQLDEGATLETSGQIVAQIERQFVGDPAFTRVFSSVGSLPSTASGRQTRGENLAQINFVLPDGGDATDEARAIERTRAVLDLFPQVESELVHPSVLTVRPPVAVDIYSDDLDSLDLAATRVADRLAGLAGIADVASTSQPGNPEITVELDRERAADLGVQAEELARSLRRQIGGEVVGEFREDEERLDIRLRASHGSRDRASEVEKLRFRLANGAAIPVAAVADVRVARGPAAIHRSGGARVARVSATIGSVDLGRTLQTVRTDLEQLDLPAGAVAELAGQDEELEVSFSSLRLALLLAVFMVYVVMAIQFESLRYPFVILLSVPLGLIGVVGALWLTGTSISVLSLIGTVMLAGIVVNNAIVLVDAINRRRREGDDLETAILQAGGERLRPILMTTATTVLALLPMALGLGAGDELRRPMAVTVIGGLSVATLLTLVIIPCLYRAFTREGAVLERIDPGVALEAAREMPR